MDNNNKKFRKELDERYQRRLKKGGSYQQKEYVIKKDDSLNKQIKPKYKQEIVVLDSEDRDKTKYPLINDFVLNLVESLKNVLVIRLLRSEYTIEEYYASMIINQNRVPIQFFKSFTTFIYLNGYKKINIANGNNNNIFSQVSAGIEVLPAISTNFFYDPYAVVLNPIESKLKRFDIKILDGKGNKIPIENSSTARLILTLAVFTI